MSAEHSSDKKNLETLHAELGAEDAFERDAAEGISSLDHDSVQQTLARLDRSLKKHTSKRSRRHAAGPDRITYIAVITTLLLAIIAWLVIRKFS